MAVSRNTLLLAKLEDTYGVDSAPTTADIIEIADFNITPNIDKVERNLFRPSLSPVASLPTKKYTKIDFTVELKGAGVDSNGLAIQPKVVDLMQACGMALTVNSLDTDGDGTVDKVEYVLTPTSQNIKSLTFYAYLDGVLYKVVGARGNVSINLEANQVGQIKFEFTGLFIPPVDEPFPDVSCDTGVVPPIVKGVNLTMGGYAPIISSMEVNLNNSLTQRDDMNSPEGVREVIITGRNTQGSINPDLMLASEYDIWAKFLNNEPQEIMATVGSEVGNTVEIDIPQAVYNSIGIGDRDSVRIYNVEFSCVGCDDEIKITFK